MHPTVTLELVQTPVAAPSEVRMQPLQGSGTSSTSNLANPSFQELLAQGLHLLPFQQADSRSQPSGAQQSGLHHFLQDAQQSQQQDGHACRSMSSPPGLHLAEELPRKRPLMGTGEIDVLEQKRQALAAPEAPRRKASPTSETSLQSQLPISREKQLQQPMPLLPGNGNHQAAGSAAGAPHASAQSLPLFHTAGQELPPNTVHMDEAASATPEAGRQRRDEAASAAPEAGRQENSLDLFSDTQQHPSGLQHGATPVSAPLDAQNVGRFPSELAMPTPAQLTAQQAIDWLHAARGGGQVLPMLSDTRLSLPLQTSAGAHQGAAIVAPDSNGQWQPPAAAAGVQNSAGAHQRAANGPLQSNSQWQRPAAAGVMHESGWTSMQGHQLQTRQGSASQFPISSTTPSADPLGTGLQPFGSLRPGGSRFTQLPDPLWPQAAQPPKENPLVRFQLPPFTQQLGSQHAAGSWQERLQALNAKSAHPTMQELFPASFRDEGVGGFQQPGASPNAAFLDALSQTRPKTASGLPASQGEESNAHQQTDPNDLLGAWQPSASLPGPPALQMPQMPTTPRTWPASPLPQPPPRNRPASEILPFGASGPMLSGWPTFQPSPLQQAHQLDALRAPQPDAFQPSPLQQPSPQENLRTQLPTAGPSQKPSAELNSLLVRPGGSTWPPNLPQRRSDAANPPFGVRISSSASLPGAPAEGSAQPPWRIASNSAGVQQQQQRGEQPWQRRFEPQQRQQQGDGANRDGAQLAGGYSQLTGADLAAWGEEPNRAAALPQAYAGKEESYKRLATGRLLRSLVGEQTAAEAPNADSTVGRMLRTEQSRRQVLAGKIADRLHQLAQQRSELEEQGMRQLMDSLHCAPDESVPLAEQENIVLQVVRDMNRMGRTTSATFAKIRERLANMACKESWSRDPEASSLQRVLRAWTEGKEGSTTQGLSVGQSACDTATLEQVALMTEDAYCHMHALYEQAIGKLLPEAINAQAPSAAAAQQQAMILVRELLSLRASYGLGRPLSIHTLCKEQTAAAAKDGNFRMQMARLVEVANLSREQIAQLWQLWRARCQSIEALSSEEALLEGQLPGALAAAAKARSGRRSEDGPYSRLLRLVAELHARREEQVAVGLLCNLQAVLQVLEPLQVAAMCACAAPFHVSLELLILAGALPKVALN